MKNKKSAPESAPLMNSEAKQQYKYTDKSVIIDLVWLIFLLVVLNLMLYLI